MTIFTPNYSSFTIDFCFFIQCKAYAGGALFIGLEIPYIYINHTRFEDNSNSAGQNGADIIVGIVPCLNSAKNNTLDSSVCSTTPLSERIHCFVYSAIIFDSSQLQNTCPKEVV
jgi:hypothetical protein